MKLTPYPNYKPSGVEWLGDVPEHWEARRLKDVGTLRGGAGFPHEEQDVEGEELPFYKVGDLKASLDGRVMGNPEHTISKETARKLRAAIIPPDSIVYAKIGAALLLNRRRVTSANCCIDNNMTAYLPEKQRIRADWALYWLSTLDFGEFMNPGAVPSFSEGYQGFLPILVPPLIDQQAIAAYLDRETGRVDRLVAKKRELIERLKEKRTALISSTVTRGLPPAAARAAGLPDMSAEASAKAENPPLKPSGLDWLGDIPVHWEIKPVKFVARIGNGSTPSRDNPSYWEEGDYPWLNSSVVNQENITEAEEFVTSLALRDCHLPKIAPPAVLIGITGQGRTRGMASTLMFEATINQHVAYLKPFSNCAEVGFLRRVFDMVYLFLRSESDGGGSTKGAITCEQIANLKIPVPPLPEQAAIAAYLDEETAKLDALVGKVEEAVERLQEYRTALITAAVTGKIDVRKCSHPLR